MSRPIWTYFDETLKPHRCVLVKERSANKCDVTLHRHDGQLMQFVPVGDGPGQACPPGWTREGTMVDVAAPPEPIRLVPRWAPQWPGWAGFALGVGSVAAHIYLALR